MNEKQKQTPEESPKNTLGEPVAPVSSWKKLLSKKWVYPAAYVAAAAIILTLVWVYQDAGNKQVAQNTTATVTDEAATDPAATQPQAQTDENKAVETTAISENFVWPVAAPAEVSIVKPYYDKDGSTEEHEAAMVQYQNEFIPNTGIDLARSDKQTFEVKAALGGQVTHVEQHALNGYTVEITNANNLKTVYESLADVKVKEGDKVKQGDAIASSGLNEIGKTLGNHLHFAVYENDEPVNPTSLLPEQ